jgi:hypothetical protein
MRLDYTESMHDTLCVYICVSVNYCNQYSKQMTMVPCNQRAKNAPLRALHASMPLPMPHHHMCTPNNAQEHPACAICACANNLKPPHVCISSAPPQPLEACNHCSGYSCVLRQFCTCATLMLVCRRRQIGCAIESTKPNMRHRAPF